MSRAIAVVLVLLGGALNVHGAEVGNRLTYLDGPCDPYYVGLGTARLITPQWAGEEGVELAVVLSIDDLQKPPVYEKFLRPILNRLKQIEGRAAVSMMTKSVDPNDPQLAPWFQEGVNLGAHTLDHPCPCLQGSNFEKAKGTYDGCVDGLKTLFPAAGTISYRMPCCDSMNSTSPRYFAEIFNKTTPKGNFLELDSSVFVLSTPNDPALPRELVIDPDRRARLGKYVPTNKKWVNYVEDYPYPYVIDRLCWEMPMAVPGDWQGTNLHKACNPVTVRDMQAALDAAATKQGVYVLCFHPHGWVTNAQVIELVDHAASKYGKRVRFLNFRDVLERITKNVLGGVPLRAANGQDNGVRVLDLNHDGYMDVVIGNPQRRQTRLWSPEKKQWIVGDFPVALVTIDSQGNRLDAGVRFGVLQKNGYASILVRNEKIAGLWHFDGRQWVADPQGLAGLEADGPIATSAAGRDRGVRLADLDRDGICELVVGNETQRAVFSYGWRKLPFTLPPGTALVDALGRDAGGRLVDFDEDGRLDFVFSGPRSYSLHLFRTMADGWSRQVLDGQRGDPGEILPFVREDGTNNGAWFKHRQIWVQNEDTGGKELPSQAASYLYSELLRTNLKSAPRAPASSLPPSSLN